MKKKIKKLPVCKLCSTVTVQKRGTLCKGCETIVATGKKMAEIGIEWRSDQNEIRDMNGFTEYLIAFDPMLKFNNAKFAAPKAIAVGNVWYARLDKNHPLHGYLESEWKRIGGSDA